MAGDVTEANALAVAHMGLVKQIARKIKAVMPITIDRDIMRRDFLEADQKAPEHDTELADFWSSPLPWVSARDWRVLQMYYRDGMAMREIGAIIGCCESNVWRIIEKIRLRAAS